LANLALRSGVLLSVDDGFAGFYEASYSRVVALLAAMTGDWHQAEDVAQEAFARALARWQRLASYDAPEAWVRQVALRLVVDAARRSRRAVRASALLAVAQRGRADPDPVAETELTAALLRLPLPQREVLVLHYLADLPVADIARDCRLPEGTVKTRLAAGRLRLERELAASAKPSQPSQPLQPSEEVPDGR
jgi:RNA polymerase sigma-70 factor (ECF subfamily)